MKIFKKNGKWILAALSATIIITCSSSAQITTKPTIKRVPAVEKNAQLKIPTGVVKPDVPKTPGVTTTAPSRSTTTTDAKQVVAPPQKISPVRKGAIIDFSAKLPQLSTVSVSMICASSENNPKSVILKWVIDNNWLPEQGFNLYRKESGDSDFKKIAGPIKENPGASPIVLSTINGLNKTVNISALQKQAKTNVQIPADMMRAFSPAPTNIETSKPIFDELKQLRIKEFTPVIAGTRPDFSVTKPDAYPKLNGYFQRFKIQRSLPFKTEAIKTQNITPKSSSIPAAKTGTQRLAAITKSPVQVTVEARRALLMGSLINKSVSDALGLGYVDNNVVEGETYEYQLRKITGSGDTSVASCNITVGADPLPAKPEELSACQLDLSSVALRWKLDAAKTSARVISYNIYRTQNGKRQLANPQPLMVGLVEDGKGNYADPIYYYTDQDVPVGDIKYELIGVDAFGRHSETTKLDFTMQDWETPLPVNQITCAVNNGQVYIYWQPSLKSNAVKNGNAHAVATSKLAQGNAAMYNIYRYDQEATKVWTKLNSEPVKPAFISPPTLGNQYARKLASMNRSSNLSYIDKTCKDDTYYQYTVVAVYKKNMIESAPSPSQTVGVPDTNKPAVVESFEGKHIALVSQTPQLSFDARWIKAFNRPTAPVSKVKNLSFDPAILKRTIPKEKVASAQAVEIKSSDDKKTKVSPGIKAADRVSPVKLPKDLIKATANNSDLGGRVALTWKASPLKAPVRYKVYRSNGTGFKVTSGFDKLALNTNAAKLVSKAVNPVSPPEQKVLRPASSFQYMGAKPSDVRVLGKGKKTNLPAIQNKGVSLEFIKKVDIASITLDSYQLLGETASPAYQDFLPKSRPMYYTYRVVAIDRWGNEGKPAVIQVRVAATVQPPTPEIVSTYPNSDGGVTVTLKPLENKEECEKYLVYRKPVDLSLIIKNTKSISAVKNVQAAAMVSNAAPRQSGPVKISADMKIAPVSAIVSSAAASKARDHGMRSRQIMPLSNMEFAKNLRQVLVKQDYEVIGEIGADAIDKSGYVRYNDMKDLTPNQLYSYTVVAVDADDWKSPASKPETASPWKVIVPPVSNLKAAPSGNGVLLSWTAPAGEILGYVVLKGIAKNTQFVQISDTIKPATFTDFSVIKGRSYTYHVQAVDSLGNLSEPVAIDYTLPK
ncbi:MAG: hypothetical protein ACYC27_03945 [Armatimonadota bacterium]